MTRKACEWYEACELLGEKSGELVLGTYLSARMSRRRSKLTEALWSGLVWFWAGWGALQGDNAWIRFGYVTVGVVAGGYFGRRLVEVLPVRVDLSDLFNFGPGSFRFWAELEPLYRKNKFAKLLQEHGPQPFVPRDLTHLRRALLGDQSAWGSYPARLLRNHELKEAGLGAWVSDKTSGAIEMADVLCEAPGAKTLDDLVGLMERIRKKPERTPAPA